MTTTGRCLCGAIQFEFAGEAVETTHCHCESCGRQTSSPVATFVTVHDSALRITRGQPTEIPPMVALMVPAGTEPAMVTFTPETGGELWPTTR
jgi:Glutathione-dependent formaldehyde-activating enzyme